jgi:DNA-binding XRE family transcriptional regulator
MQINTACVVATERTWSKISAMDIFSDAQHFTRLRDVPWNGSFHHFFVDCSVSDLDLWPLPILASHPAYKFEPSAFLIKVDTKALVEPISIGGPVLFDQHIQHFGELIRRALNPKASKRIVGAHLLADHNSLLMHLAEGKSYLISLEEIGLGDPSTPKSVEISSNGEYVTISQASGRTYEIPWDLVLRHFDFAHPVSKSKGTKDQAESASRIGQRIAELRTTKGMTISDLAEESGFLRPNLSRTEAGKHMPSLDTLERIAEALGVPVAELIAKSN